MHVILMELLMTMKVVEYESCAGCTDAAACNYDSEATIDDESCDYSCLGCTDSDACNFDPEATIDDESCVYWRMW